MLHRDMSIYNILMYPKHHADTMTTRVYTKNPPKFIQDVLHPNEPPSQDGYVSHSFMILIPLADGREALQMTMHGVSSSILIMVPCSEKILTPNRYNLTMNWYIVL